MPPPCTGARCATGRAANPMHARATGAQIVRERGVRRRRCVGIAGARLGDMTIGDIMRRSPWVIQASDALGAAQRAMARGHIRHLPVLQDGKLVGLLSERDVLAARARAGADEEWWQTPVRAAMSAPPQTAAPDESLTEAAGRMAAAKIGALPVVERGKLLGLVTVTDVLAAEVAGAMAPAPPELATAADAMTPWPLTVRPETPLADAVALMVDHHIRHLPVLDATSAVVGMLAERDVRTAIGDPFAYIEKRSRSEAQYKVRDVMSRPVITVPFDRPLVELARSFADGRIGAVPVTDRFGALIGIVSYVDALRALAAGR